MRRFDLIFGIGLICFSTLGMAHAQEPTPQAGAAPAAVAPPATEVKPATALVEFGPVQKAITVAGHFIAQDAHEVRLNLKSISSFEVVEAVKHGTPVKAGDVLVQFDAASLKEQIQQQETSLYSLKLAHEEALREAKFDETREAIEGKKAEIEMRVAKEDHKFFQEKQHPFSAKELEASLKSTQDYVDYAAEEVRQLEKMYKADDLTEESEEIVLRRAKDDLARSRFSLEEAKLNYEKTKRFGLARSKENEELAHKLAVLAMEQAALIRPILKEKKLLQLKLQAIELEKSSKKLQELKNDLEQAKVLAPADGVVYLGRAIDGKWTNVKEMGMKLMPHGTVMNHEVFMTVVDPKDLAVRATIAEGDMTYVSIGMKGNISPTAFPGQKSEVTLSRLDAIPGEDGSFVAMFDANLQGKKPIVAGMTGNIRLVVYFQPKAMLLPTKVIFKEELDEHARFVFLRQQDGSIVKRAVEVGLEQGERSEILQGINAGDEVLVEKPVNK